MASVHPTVTVQAFDGLEHVMVGPVKCHKMESHDLHKNLCAFPRVSGAVAYAG